MPKSLRGHGTPKSRELWYTLGMFPLFLALKYLRPKRGIASVVTLLSVFGVTIGVAIVIIVRAVFTGFGDTWESKILGFQPHVVVRSAMGPVIGHELRASERLEALPGVEVASPSVATRVLVEHDKRLLAPVLLGVDAERARRSVPLEMAQGAFDLAGDSVVIGVDLARGIGARLGDELEVYSPMNLVKKDEIYLPERLTVTGIYRTGQADYDQNYLFVSLPVGRDLAGLSRGANAISLRVADPQGLRPGQGLVAEVQRAVDALYGPGRCEVNTWQQLDSLIFNAVATEKNMMTLLLIFISVVAVFCVVNTIIVITVQKTNEIGLLKSLGFSTGQLTATFVLYGWIQCVVGVALGIGLAFLILNNLQNLVDLLARFGMDVFPKEVYGLDALPWRVVPLEIAQVIVLVVGFCALASFLPAWRAAAMNPVDALRKE